MRDHGRGYSGGENSTYTLLCDFKKRRQLLPIEKQL